MTSPPSGPQRIVFLDLARRFWGAEQSLFTLVDALRPLGHECTLVAWSQELADEWTSRGLGDVVLLEAPARHSRKADYVALLRGRRLIPPADALVVFSVGLLPLVPLLRLLPRFRRTAFALDLHDTPEGPRGKALLRGVGYTFSSVISVSAFAAEQVSWPRPTVLLRPVQPPADVPAPEPGHDALVVGLIGRLDPAKEHELAIRALAHTDAKVRLVIRGAAMLGGNAYVERLQELADASPYDVLLEGRVAPEAALDGLDAVLVANRSEPMGRTAVEAQLRGLPVIVPDSGGASELVEDGVTGLTFAAGVETSLAAAYDRLARDPDLRRRLGQTAREVAIARHDPTTYARAYAAALTRPRTRTTMSASPAAQAIPAESDYTVLHVINALSTGGAQTLIEAMAARRLPGQTLRLVVLSTRDTLSDRLEAVFDSVDYLNFEPSSYALHQLVRDLHRVVSRIKPDVIHSHLIHADLASALLPRGNRVRVSTVHTMRMTTDDKLRSRLLSYAVGLLARRFDAVVACDETCLLLTRSRHYPAAKVSVIPNGVPIADLPAAGDPGPVLLSLSRWHPVKDHATLFRAAAVLRDRGVTFRLVCAGSGIEASNAELVGLIDAAGVGDLVDLLGPSDDIPGLLAGARVLVMSSAYGEAMPMSGLEALSAGRPVVTTNVGGCPQLGVEPALVVPPSRPDLMADALQDVLERSTEDWSALCNAALALARSTFDIDTTVASYEKVYRRALLRRSLMSRPRRPAATRTRTTEDTPAAVVCLTPRGGHLEHAFNLASAIAAANGAVTVLISRAGAADYLPAQRDGVRVLEIPEFVEAPSVKDKVSRTLRETNDVRRLLSGLTGLRLVVLEEPIMALAVPPSPRIQTVSVVHNVRDHDSQNAGLATRLRAAAKALVLVRSRRVIVHGREQGEAVPKVFARKVRVVELPGIGAFESGHAGAQGVSPLTADVFVCLGEMRPNKNYEDAIRAAALSGQPVVIAGAAVDPDYLDRLQGLVDELSAPVTFFSQFIDASGFAAILSTCRAAVIPYRFFAAQSGVLERAVAAGAPVISADLPALVEQAAGRPGVSFYPAGDAAALAALLTAAPARADDAESGMDSDPRWADLAGHALR